MTFIFSFLLQAPNAMPPFVLAFDIHSLPEIIISSYVVKYYAEKLQYNYNHTTVQTSIGIINTLTKLHHELSRNTAINHLKNETYVKDYLLSRYFYAQLLGEQGYGNQFNELNRVFFSCRKEGVECFPNHTFGENIVGENIVLSKEHSSLQSSLAIRMTLGNRMDEATSQGIGNGLTLILRTGNNFVLNALNLTSLPPTVEMYDYALPSLGVSGIRLNSAITDTDGEVQSDANIEGIDIPQGFASAIGIKGKRTKHLAHPYTKCALIDPQRHLLQQRIAEVFRNKTPVRLIRFSNRPINCRYHNILFWSGFRPKHPFSNLVSRLKVKFNQDSS